MRNREFALALAIVGAVAWTARAGHPEGLTDRERIEALEDRMDRVEVHLGTTTPKPAPSKTGRRLADVEDPESQPAPKGDRLSLLYVEWMTAYSKVAGADVYYAATLKGLDGEKGSLGREVLGRRAQAAREKLDAALLAYDEARAAYLSAAGK